MMAAREFPRRYRGKRRRWRVWILAGLFALAAALALCVEVVSAWS